MKKFSMIILFAMLSTPAWATTFFLAPASGGGNDSNNGTSASTPWLSPNHAVNCGDVILAAPSTAYSASNFGEGRWGTVACPASNNVAWLKCASFDACKISASGTQGMRVSANYWGVQGWEVTATGSNGSCFLAAPPSSLTIHHIIFANDIANSCTSNGFNALNVGRASVDYIVIVGNIAYNAASGSGECFSGISIYQPQNADSVAGTHIYVAGNFSYANMDGNPCAGVTPTDGEGLIFDTFDGSQGGLAQYTQQAVAYNNIFVANGGRGLYVVNNKAGSVHAPIYFEYNTVWGNNTDLHQNATWCGEITIASGFNTIEKNNLAMTGSTNGCGSNPLFAYYVGGGNGTDVIESNWGFAASGNNDGSNNSSGFSIGSLNTFGTNPNFANPVEPGPPNCGSASSVQACMAPVIADFTPTTAAAKAYGYQIPSTSQTSDPLFPQWLCNVNLPAGLITMGCLSSSSSPAPPTSISVIVQ